MGYMSYHYGTKCVIRLKGKFDNSTFVNVLYDLIETVQDGTYTGFMTSYGRCMIKFRSTMLLEV